MRKPLAVAALLTMLGPAHALAQPDKRIDVSALTSELVILHDGAGHYLAVFRGDDKRDTHVFYGTGKKLYKQGLAVRRHKNDDFEVAIRSQRTRSFADLRLTAGQWTVKCREKPVRLTALEGKDRRAFLARTWFHERKFRRWIAFFARDESANYYVVDTLEMSDADQRTGVPRGVRFFRGRPGRMKRMRLKELAYDFQGMVGVTPVGTLIRNKIKRVNIEEEGFWITKKKVRHKLKVLSTNMNRELIFNTLGIYTQRMETVCEDL